MTDRRRRLSLGSAGFAALKGGSAGYDGTRRRGSMPVAEVESLATFRKGR